MNQLNKEQISAVTSEGDVLVNACVGSGKTTVLIERILYLNRTGKIPFERMAVITFTNKAADEIRERITAHIPDITPDNLKYFGTFHGLALTCLKNCDHLEDAGFTKDFQVITPDEELELALNITEEKKLKVLYKNRLKKKLENYFSAPEKEKGKPQKDDFLALTQLLSEEKKRLNRMSFHDLIYYVTNLPECSPAFDQVLVDEVQDCDRLQLDMLDRLLKAGHADRKRASLFAVGDPNQIIYSFRGSCFNIFPTLVKRYQAKVCTLTQNYRSCASILSAAHRFQESGEALNGIDNSRMPLIIHESYDPFADAMYIADRITGLHEGGLPYCRIAVLYRLQNQSEIYRNVLTRQGIPCEIVKKTSVSDIPVLNWLMHLLRFYLDRDDTASAVYILTDKKYGPGLTAAKARKLIGADNSKTSDNISNDISDKISDNASDNILNALRISSATGSYSKEDLCAMTASEIFNYFRLSEHLYPTRAGYQEDEKYVMNFLEALTASCRKPEDISDFLNRITLTGSNLTAHSENNLTAAVVDNTFNLDNNISCNDAVNLMTLHASKGLEFDHCFIVGVNNGLIPVSSRSEAEQEEERRLFYVGMTRARKGLELTCYTEPGNPSVQPGPGTYLKRIPAGLSESNIRTGPAADLKTMKHMVEEERRNTKTGNENLSGDLTEKTSCAVSSAEPDSVDVNNEIFQTGTVSSKTFTHPRYGTGIVIREDALMITVRFDGIGEKDFMKDFI